MRPEALLAATLLFATASVRADPPPPCIGDGPTDVLHAIFARGSINIGTTGDYVPFSFHEGGQLQGIDIELGERLAHDLGMPLVWVPTTWSALRGDLETGKFDIAMSGVSVTIDRGGSGCFTSSYVVTGKTVIAPCDRAERFTTLPQIDREGVRVIVNPGGTNEAFVRRSLERATVVLHPDNTTIFPALAAGEADLMITDGIEAQLMTRKYSSLCAPVPNEFFERVPKALYLPKDPVWQEWVNHWLKSRREDGSLAAILARYMPDDREAIVPATDTARAP